MKSLRKSEQNSKEVECLSGEREISKVESRQGKRTQESAPRVSIKRGSRFQSQKRLVRVLRVAARGHRVRSPATECQSPTVRPSR